MKTRLAVLGLILGVLSAWSAARSPAPAATPPPSGNHLARATFAGGCFWCMEPPFDALPGVVSTVSGYAGGDIKNPSYKQVSSGRTGHAEVLQVTYDPAKTTYEQLLDVFWRNVDPLDRGGQFCDRGRQYRTGIFTHDESQKLAAEASKRKLKAADKLSGPVVTEIASLETFYPAEEYHQDFYRKNPGHYKRYRRGCGRDRRLEELWGPPVKAGGKKRSDAGKEGYVKPSKDELKKRLTPLQYQVTQKEGTERPFHNAYWDNHEHGLYVDVVSGEPLFSSLDKFDSGTGWPSFTRPVEADNVDTRTDRKLFMARVEVRSKQADSHLGHIFGDGPAPTGKRYCINSAALRFVPVEKLEEEGYGRYLALFQDAVAQK